MEQLLRDHEAVPGLVRRMGGDGLVLGSDEVVAEVTEAMRSTDGEALFGTF